jgi:hypothetical protein
VNPWPEDIEGRPVDKIELFYSYAHEDEAMREHLEKHLSIMRRTGELTEWHDRRIDAGGAWKDEIDQHLESANIILLLISSDFLGSDYCWNVEMTRALQRHKAGDAVVIPVILHPVDFDGAPFAQIQALPKDALPVSKWADPDEAFTDVVRGIRAKVRELANRTVPAGAQSLTVEVRTRAVSDGAEAAPAGGGDAAYRIGTRIVVTFRANRDCFLTLLNIGTSGRLTILFPNAMHPENRILANRLYEIPAAGDGFEYELAGPPGVERLKAVATLDDVALLESQFAPDGSLFRTVPATAAARDIAVMRKRVEGIPPVRYNEAEWQFAVV